jgi:hypothetical protein
MCEVSCAITLARFEHLVLRGRFVEEQARRVVEDGAGVLHAAEGERRNRHDVELPESVRDGRVVFEPGEGCGVQVEDGVAVARHLGRVGLAWNSRNWRPLRSAVSTEKRPAANAKR